MEITVMIAIFVVILGLAFVAEDARSGASGRLVAIVVVAVGIVAFRIAQLTIG